MSTRSPSIFKQVFLIVINGRTTLKLSNSLTFQRTKLINEAASSQVSCFEFVKICRAMDPQNVNKELGRKPLNFRISCMGISSCFSYVNVNVPLRVFPVLSGFATHSHPKFLQEIHKKGEKKRETENST